MTPDFADSIDGAVAQVTSELPPTTEPPATDLTVKNAELIAEVPVQAIATQLGDVAVDTVKLLELQVKLFESELSQSGRQLVQPVVQFAAAYVVGTASLLVLLLAISAGLEEAFHLAPWLALLIVAGVGAVIAAITIQMGIAQLKAPRISFAKSKEELMRNAAVLANLMKPPLK